jgi:YihY family inner membrane protein
MIKSDTTKRPRPWWMRVIVLPVWHAVTRMFHPTVRIVTGGVAFYALFSIFPLIYLTLTLLIATLPTEISEQVAGSIGQILTNNVAPLKEEELSIISQLTPRGLTLRAVAALLLVGYTASAGARAAITGIRMIAGSEQRTQFVRFQALSLLMTTLLVLIVWFLGAAQLTITLLREATGPAAEFADLIARIASTLWITKWVASFIVFYLVIALSLRKHDGRGRALVAGAAAGALAWLGVTWAFQLYLRFSVLDTIYGALASLILGFIWLTASVSSLLFGAALAVEWSRLQGPRKP